MLSQSLGGALYLFSAFFIGQTPRSVDSRVQIMLGGHALKLATGVKNVVNIFILKYGTHPLGVRIFPPGLPLPSGDDGGK